MCKECKPGKTVVPETTFGQQPFVGIECEKYAREDHTHGTPPAPVIPQAPNPATTVVTEQSYGQSSSVGTSTNYAREDHTHGTPTLLFNTPNNVTASRAFNAVYQNTSGKPMLVTGSFLYTATAGNRTVTTTGIIGSTNPPSMGVSETGPFNAISNIAAFWELSFIVPINWYYEISALTDGNTVSLNFWIEYT